MNTFAEIWMIIIGLSMNLGAVVQCMRILKRKKSDDVALAHSLIIGHGQAWWLWYGFRVNSFSLIIANIIGICFSVAGAILVVSYRTVSVFPWRRSKNATQNESSTS